MKKLSLLLIALLVTSCIAGETGGAPSPTPSAAPSAASTAPSAAASSTPTVSARVISGVGGLAVVSPDGKWIATREPAPGGKVPYVPAALVYDLDGKLVRRIEAPGGSWTWMPDSSGLFVALDAPQRSPLLGIADVSGGATMPTGLQMAHATLSRDGKWIVAEHQEGCCAGVTTPEIWIAARSGGDAKTLVTAKSDPKSLALLGVDASDRVVYRDGGQVLRMPMTGGTPQTLGTIADFKTTLAGDTSPDGLVILVRGYEPLRWYVVANDRVTPWADSIGTPVEDLQGERLLFGSAARWIGPHTLLVRAASGELSSFDLLTGLSTETKARLGANDLALAYDRGRLLVARGKDTVVIELATGRESDAGIDAMESDGSRASRAAALPGGGFVLSTINATYRID